jgi:hypothetical protein
VPEDIVSTTETAPAPLDQVDGRPTTDRAATKTDPDVAKAVAAPRTSQVVLRRVEPWSVFKLSLVFYLCVCLVLLVAGVMLWLGASASGVVGNIEGFFQDAGFEGFTFSSGVLLRGFALGGLVLVVAGTIANLLLAMLFNLMSDVVGGIRVTLTEDLRGKR